MTGTNRRWLLAARPTGPVERDNFAWEEAPLPSIDDGQFLVRNLWLSVDPAQRAWMEMDTYVPMLPLGEVMQSGSAGEVVESKNPEFEQGDLVAGVFGWQDYAVADTAGYFPVNKVPPGVDLPMALSLFGVTGLTAHVGLFDIGQAKPGEAVVVSGAAGAVGSVAAQIAKLHGCHTVGIAGGEEKCRWLTGELGIDAAIDYKGEDVGTRLGELCPDGVDVFFDNVGGPILDAVLDHIAMRARIVLCGAVSGYDDFDNRPALRNHYRLIIRRGTMRGFILFDHMDRVPDAIGALGGWAAEGKIVNRIDVVEGLENAPDALRRLLDGANVGKQLVKIADEA